MVCQPLVSIIIPCWNAESSIGEAIESALRQTYPEVEVVVIDDGSTDSSLDVIKSFGDRIRWESGPNKGACAARNRGVSIAKGEFIQFLDSDDLLNSRKLELQVPLALENRRNIVYTARLTHPMGLPEQYWIDSPTAGHDAVVFAISRIVHTAAPIYSRQSVLEIGGYREDLPCAQDYDFHLRLALAGWTYKKLPEVLVTIRRRSSSISSDSLRVVEKMTEIQRQALEMLRANGELTDCRRTAAAASIARGARAFLTGGKRQKGYELLSEARHLDLDGANQVFSKPVRLLHKIFGAYSTEQLVAFKRQIFNNSNRPG